uniref:CRAL-TRIO domain-containing protein n=1 Tax=Setaria digitata TaxID=48799 RepID=A0A915PZX7_9BILA
MQQRDRYLIESSVISLPGCRDRSGSPLLFINFADGSGKQSGVEAVSGPNCEELVSVISYLSQIPNENTRKLGFTVVIDGRKGTTKHIRGIMRACQQALCQRVRYVLVIQPEKFLDQQKLNFEFIKEAYQFKASWILTSLHKLLRYVDVTQLPDTLGGTLCYDPHSWTSLRQKFENYVKRANGWIENGKRHDNAMHATSSNDLLGELAQQNGSKAVKRSINDDWESAAQHVALLMKQIKNVEGWPSMKMLEEERSASLKLLEGHAEGVQNLLNWILGAGEKWLLSLREIGESYDDAKQLLKEHSELESKSMELEEQSSELVTIGHELQNEFPRHAVALQHSIDGLQQLIRAFCTRVTRQKKVALHSVNFYRMLNDFSRKTDMLLESLCTNVRATDIATAEKERDEMDAKIDELEKIYRGVINSGISFIDQLCVDESNSMCKPIAGDYSAGIFHIRGRLEETRGRRRRCQNLADVRKLKIQQLLQLYTCERDGHQVVLWIEELYETLINEYNTTRYDIERFRFARENRLKLEETARSTYGYGKQLSQVALVLRRSLRMEVQPGLKLNQKLESVWRKFCHAVNEREAKLGVIGAFHSTIQKVNERLDQLLLQLDKEALKIRSAKVSLHCFTSEKRSIADNIRELKNVTDILVQELSNKMSRSRKNTDTSWVHTLNEIQRKFAEVKRKQNRLEEICEDEECCDTKMSSGISAQLVDSASAIYSSLAECDDR